LCIHRYHHQMISPNVCYKICQFVVVLYDVCIAKQMTNKEAIKKRNLLLETNKAEANVL